MCRSFSLSLKECEWRFKCVAFLLYNPDPLTQKKLLTQWVKRYLTQLSGTAPKKLSEFPNYAEVLAWYYFYCSNLKNQLPLLNPAQGAITASKSVGGYYG